MPSRVIAENFHFDPVNRNDPESLRHYVANRLLYSVGKDPITATQSGNPAINGTQSGITVNPAATTAIVIASAAGGGTPIGAESVVAGDSLTVYANADAEAPKPPFRLDEVARTGALIAIGIRASRVADLHAFRICRADLTAGEEGCATRVDVPKTTTIYTDTTVTAGNVRELPQILRFVLELEAALWSVFLLVPTGRGAGLEAAALAVMPVVAVMAVMVQRAGQRR